MKENITVKEITEKVANSSTEFEETNTDLKRKYLIWNIEAFNIIASAVSVSCGTFGTGYPFYALDRNLEGTLPVIQEQIRYNRSLVEDGRPVQELVWQCRQCIKEKYATMPDLKKICKPCPKMPNELKPRKIINRMLDIDMWLVCQDGCTEKAQEELAKLLKKYRMRTSDEDPILSIEEMSQISRMIKEGKRPKIYLPIDVHIIEYSKLKELINQVPEVLERSHQEGINPYLAIRPISYRKQWEYDPEGYNFIYDYLAAFSEFNFCKEMQEELDKTRARIAGLYSTEELFEFLIQSSSPANARRFQNVELESYFEKRIINWKEKSIGTLNNTCGRNQEEDDEFFK